MLHLFGSARRLVVIFLWIALSKANAETCTACPDGTNNVANPSQQLSLTSQAVANVGTCGELSSYFDTLDTSDADCPFFQSSIGISECGCDIPTDACYLCGNTDPIPKPDIVIENIDQTCGDLQKEIWLDVANCNVYQQFFAPSCSCDVAPPTCPIPTCPDGTAFDDNFVILDDDGNPTGTCGGFRTIFEASAPGVDCQFGKASLASFCGCQPVANPCTLCAGGESLDTDCPAASDILSQLSFIDASSDLCTSVQISGVVECECTSFPAIPSPTESSCNLCEGGTFPTKPDVQVTYNPFSIPFVVPKTCSEAYYKAHLSIDEDSCVELKSFAGDCGCNAVATSTIPPTKAPTFSPTDRPSRKPTFSPTDSPSSKPTFSPTDSPSRKPTDTSTPTGPPVDIPTEKPTPQKQTDNPTEAKKSATDAPSFEPTDSPSQKPAFASTRGPTLAPTGAPTKQGGTTTPSKAPVSIEPTGNGGVANTPTIDIPAILPTSPPSIAPAIEDVQTTSPAGDMHGGQLKLFVKYGVFLATAALHIL